MMTMFRLTSALAVACLSLCQPVSASDTDIETADLSREDLVARIIAAGTSVSDGRRTGVEIDGCMVTTFAHEPYKDFGWTLYTLFEFDLGLVKIDLSSGSGGAVFVEGNSVHPSMAIVVINAIPPYKVPHEVPAHREPKNPVRRSEREGVVDYFFTEAESFIVVMENVTGPEQGQAFARGLMRFRSEYCLPSLS